MMKTQKAIAAKDPDGIIPPHAGTDQDASVASAGTGRALLKQHENEGSSVQTSAREKERKSTVQRKAEDAAPKSNDKIETEKESGKKRKKKPRQDQDPKTVEHVDDSSCGEDEQLCPGGMPATKKHGVIPKSASGGSKSGSVFGQHGHTIPKIVSSIQQQQETKKDSMDIAKTGEDAPDGTENAAVPGSEAVAKKNDAVVHGSEAVAKNIAKAVAKNLAEEVAKKNDAVVPATEDAKRSASPITLDEMFDAAMNDAEGANFLDDF
jgi:hypothetical protein